MTGLKKSLVTIYLRHFLHLVQTAWSFRQTFRQSKMTIMMVKNAKVARMKVGPKVAKALSPDESRRSSPIFYSILSS